MNAEIRDHDLWFRDLLTTGTDSADSGIRIRRAAATSPTYDAQVSADAQPRLRILASGKIEWSSGTSVTDTSLERAGAGFLKLVGTDARFYLQTTNAASPYTALAFLDSTGARKFQIDWAAGSTGIVRLGSLTGAAGSETFTEAMRIDPDTPGVSQFRGATASTRVALSTIHGLSNNGTWNLRADGYMSWGDGTLVTDVNLYRLSANRLQTDHYFKADMGLCTKAYAGVISDGTFPGLTPQSGTIAVDTTNNRLYVKVGSTWKYVALV